MPKVSMLARRLGTTTRCSPLDFKLKRLFDRNALQRFRSQARAHDAPEIQEPFTRCAEKLLTAI